MRIVGFVVPAMDCTADEAAVRRSLAALPGVERTDVDLAQRRLTVAHMFAKSAIVAALNALGMPPRLLGEDAPGESARSRRLCTLTFAAAGALALGSEAVALAGLGERHPASGRWRRPPSSCAACFAVIGAAALGEWPEAAMVVVLFVLVEWIEVRALDYARTAVRSLRALAPDHATVR